MTSPSQLNISSPPSSNALKYPRFVYYWLSSWAGSFAIQILSVAVGWQIYDLTHSTLYLGFVGLAQFLPALLLVLVTGLVADSYNRRKIILTCLFLEGLCALGLVAFTSLGTGNVVLVFMILASFGLARAFLNPATDALAPNLVPKQALAHAVSLSSLSWQTASIAGPALGGLLYGISGQAAYGTATALLLVAFLLVVIIGHVPQAKPQKNAHSSPQSPATTMQTLFAGFRFIKSDPIVLGAISLDMFAVLLGGAVALMPVYARDILTVGPWGLGLLRASPAVGAVIVAIILAKITIRTHAGKLLFLCVSGFGLFTIIFGLSTTLWISITALVMMGACDMVSVFVRKTLIQLRTPDEVRGRVNAVNRVFIGASNELGEFRAGTMASFIGTVPAVALGGVGTIAIAALWYYLFPALRNTQRLDGK